MDTSTAHREAAFTPWLVGLLALGDGLALLTFAAVGRASHSLTAGVPLLAALLTAAPFAAAWVIVAPLVGAYRGRNLVSPGRWLARTALAWLMAEPLGLVLRAQVLGRPIIPIFALVTLAAAGAILLAWRGLFWLAYEKLAGAEARRSRLE